MAFGSFWLANGIQMLIRTYFPEEIPDVYTGKDAWGHAIRYFYLAGFVGGLWIQTLKINKATTTLITFLFFKLIFGAFETSVKTCEWIAVVLTWIVSIIAFGLFVAEFTNEAPSGAASDFSVTPSHRRRAASTPSRRANAGLRLRGRRPARVGDGRGRDERLRRARPERRHGHPPGRARAARGARQDDAAEVRAEQVRHFPLLCVPTPLV